VDLGLMLTVARDARSFQLVDDVAAVGDQRGLGSYSNK
jgi:hypothetical protein